MKEYIEEIGQNIKNIRSAIENQGVDIPEDTPLDEYADKIAEIERPTVEIGHDILPFYCYADNEVDASNKSEPTIEWNSEKATWDITEYEDGWTQSIPSDNPNKLLYAMFVPIKEGQNSSDDTFAWPKAIRLQGKKGEKGEEGNDGRDGVIAGMIQYLAAHLFKIVLRDEVANELTKPVLTYDYRQISNEANRHPKPDFLQIKNTNGEFENIPEKSTSSNNTWGLNYELPSENPENYAVLKCVASYNSLSDYVDVTDPIMLSGEGVVEWIEHYCITNNNMPPGDDATWTNNEIPNEFYEPGEHYLWNKTEIEYDSGRTVITSPVMIMSSPNAVDTIECLYGQSSNISTVPDDWTENIPDDFIVLWKKETTTFTIGDPKVTITPIAVKGNPGVDILAQVEKKEVDQWTSKYMSSFNSDEYYLKKGIIVGRDLYIWNGLIRPEWTTSFWKTQGGYYWIIIKDAFVMNVQADWNEDDDTMPGYVKNKPINITEREIENQSDTGGNIDGVEIISYNTIIFEISPYEEISELSITLTKSSINGGDPVSISLSKTNNSARFGPYSIELTKYGIYGGSLMTPFENARIESYHIKLKRIDLIIHPSSNIIELTGNHSTLKLAILKESKNLIPGCKYKFWYNNKPYVVEAMANDILDNTCSQENNTVTVNWDKSLFNCGIVIKEASTCGKIVKIDAPRSGFTIWYNVLTNKFCNNIPTSFDQKDECSNRDATDLVDSWLYIYSYKDARGNEWNLHDFVIGMLSYNISFDDRCFGNKVNVYLTDPHTSSVVIVNITSGSNNNIISCYNTSDIECVAASGNTISVMNNSKKVNIYHSHLNNVTLMTNVPLSCRVSDCNTVYIYGVNPDVKSINLSDTKCNLIKLYRPNSNITVDYRYESCVILNESALSSPNGGSGKVFASEVVTTP